MVRLVLDANVIISAIFGGAPLEAVHYASEHTICINGEIEKELFGVVEKLKNRISPLYYKELKKQIKTITKIQKR